ncbi:MAG TPA: hypothetical protein DCZ95_00495 [Verrucomicrobia bacterium]|nr:MAG: hypothetical protein A2X46_05865 [Lentisphaerae bacterium GWF2_57_35]HBA82548.1 hypothetical protein [Verrucomicrobiota bacterium]
MGGRFQTQPRRYGRGAMEKLLRTAGPPSLPLAFRWPCAFRRALPGLLLASALAAGCSPHSSRREVEWPSPEMVCILQPVISNRTTQASMDVLSEFFPGAPVFSAGDAEEGFKRCSKEGRVLLIPSSTYLPAKLWPDLQLYMAHGGSVVFTGCDPLRERVVQTEQGCLTQAGYLARLAANAETIEGFSNVQLWRHQNSDQVLRGAVRIVRDVALPWPGVQVEAEGFEGWDALVQEEVPVLAGAGSLNSFVFYARGDDTTSQLMVECVEDDGAHWFCRQSLSTNWVLQVLHEGLFEYAHGAIRDTPGRRLKMSRIRKISVGLFNQYAPQTPGAHVFAVSDIRLLDDPRPLEEAVEWPDLFLIAPPYRHYDLDAQWVQASGGDDKIYVGKARLQSPLPRSRGWGGEKAPSSRWISVADGLDEQGQLAGWPASLCIHVNGEGGLARWGWLGLNLSKATLRPARLMLGECIRRLREGMFLHKAGFRQMSFQEGDALLATARWTSSEHSAVSVARVMAELIDAEGRVNRRVVSPPTAYGEVVDLNLGLVPRVVDGVEEYTLRMTLIDARVPNRHYDQLEQPVKFLAPPVPSVESARVSTVGPYFTYGKRPLFLLGVNYWPASVNGRTPTEPGGHWLDAPAFDPELIGRDLDRLVSAGLNVVSIQYLDETQAPQLLYFLDEAKKRGLWVHLFVDSLQPLSQDLTRARRLIEAVGLKDQPQVFALDIAWEPHLGSYQERCRLNPEWALWLREQYGTVEHAEKIIGRPLWKIIGQVTGPSDEELSTDGDHRAAVAVYRRFIDDYMSRQYGHVKRFLRSIGCRQLIGARSGYGGTGNAWGDRFFPIDPASGAAHLDFISPEGWGLQGEADRFFEAGFLTAYARGVSDGKPVLWTEFGCSVGQDPQPVDLENQARIYRQMFDMLVKSDAAGGLGWWFPGGYRVDEKTDMGIVHPDGSWRPVGQVYQQFAHSLRQTLNLPKSWAGREIDRDADARGLSALWSRWKDAYRKECSTGRMEEVRPLGFNKPTTELTPISVGGVPYAAPAPLQSVDAEWGGVVIDGKEFLRSPGARLGLPAKQNLQLELINTGAALWVSASEKKPGTVWVQVSHALREPQYIRAGQIGFGKSCRISWTPSDPGVWHLRPWLWDVGGFGETLEVEVRNRRE